MQARYWPIHARRNAGAVRFRFWSEHTDSYMTEELTEEEIREVLLADTREMLKSLFNNEVNLERAMLVYKDELDERIRRTVQKGTSSLIPGARRRMNGPWGLQADEWGEEDP